MQQFDQTVVMLVRNSFHLYLKTLFTSSKDPKLTKLGISLMHAVAKNNKELLNKLEIQRLKKMAEGKEKQHEDDQRIYDMEIEMKGKKEETKKMNFKSKLKDINKEFKTKGLFTVVKSKMKLFLDKAKKSSVILRAKKPEA